MKVKYPLFDLCPACHIGSLKRCSYVEVNPGGWSFWQCLECSVKVSVDENSELFAHYFTHHQNDKKYQAIFYPDGQFQLHAEHEAGRDILICLKFHPNITQQNFPDKLKTILLFM